jgi:hypothetical protein
MFPEDMAWKMSGFVSWALNAAPAEAKKKVRLECVMTRFCRRSGVHGKAAEVNFM